MNRLTTNLRQGVLIALGAIFAATAASAAEQATGEVTVQAERPRVQVVGRSQIGAPVVFVEVRHRVGYSDLDLAIASNAKVLKARVRDAARGACSDLDTLYPISTSGSADCARKAEERAMPQLLSRIAAAEARKTAAD